jgi:hypothetical protein
MPPQPNVVQQKQVEDLWRNERLSGADIARRLGLPESTVRQWVRTLKQGLQAPKLAPVPTLEADAMELAALRQRLKIESPKLEVYGGVEEEPFPVQEMWQRYEVSNAKKIEKALNQSKFKITMETSDPIGICFVSDQHISGDNCVDLKQMRLDAEFIANTPRIFAVLGGDGIDNHIKHRSATLAARSQPDDQLRLYDYYLQILAEKIAVVISGNHDHWTNQLAGVDTIKWLAEKNKLRYSPHSAYIEWQVGRVPYRICIAHQFRFNSSMNLTHTVKQMLSYGEHDFDIGCVCHHHDHAMEEVRRQGLLRWFFRPGAYQIHSDYAAQYGYGSAQPTCPTAVVFPSERKIVGFGNVRDAARYMGVV